jgi:phosphatidylinositol phospholipase C epsilon
LHLINRSEKLKPFWLSISDKDQPFLKDKLSKALLTVSEPSQEYKSAVIRALDIPHSKVIPFFGAFLRDLKSILQGMPSLVVLPFESDNSGHIKLDFVSDFNGEDHYM